MSNHNPAILLITPFHKSQRGNTVTTQRICRGLKQQGTNVRLISMETPDYQCQLQRHLQDNKPNIVHVFNGFYLAQLLENHPLLYNYRLIVTLTGTDLNQPEAGSYRALSQVFAVASFIIVFHVKHREKVLSLWPHLKEKIVVIPQGVLLPPAPNRHRREFDIEDDNVVFLLPSGLRPVKNLDLAIDGLQLAIRSNPRIRLLMMGAIIDATYARMILERIKTLPWVNYLGEISYSEIGGVFRLGDAVINCSHSEGQPQGALEAMSLGIPPILSDVPGNRGIISPGREGFYVRNPQELCRAANILACRPQLRQRMGQAARQLVLTKFNAPEEIRQHMGLYLRLQTPKAP